MSQGAGTTANDKQKIPDFVGQPVDPAIDASARERLVDARIALLIRQAFFGQLSTRLELTNPDDWLPTAATDGKRFFYNSRFVNSLSDKELQFLFGHEILHVVFDHFTRRRDRQPMIWNYANDFVVNQTLVDERVGEIIKKVQICYDPKYKGWHSEKVYEDIEQNFPKIKIKYQTIDEHIDFSEDGDEGSDGNQQGNTPGKYRMSKEEAEKVKREFMDATIQAAKSAGNAPNCVKALIKDLTEAKVDWRQLLRQTIMSTIKSNYSYARPNKNYFHQGIVIPSTIPQETIDIALTIDTSGSVSDEMLKDFLSEVKGIMEEYKDFKLHLWHFSCGVHNPVEFTMENLDEINTYEIQERGGTTFEVNWQFMKENGIEPKLLVFMTDGYPCGDWCPPGDENYTDMLWIIHGSDTIVPPFGQHAYMHDWIEKNGKRS